MLFIKRILVFLFVFALLSACSKKETKADTTLFTRLNSGETGIAFSNNLTENDSLNYFTYAYMYMGGGVAAGDFNNDGLTDLYFTGNMVSNKLYLNKGNLKFEDITKSAGVAGSDKWYTGVTIADVNADGYLDIYCSVGGKFGPRNNELYINNGDLTFTERAKEMGVDDIGNSVQGTFFDYDLDGDLDLYVGNYPITNFNAPNDFYYFKTKNVTDEETDNLYRNDGSGFTKVTNEAGVRSFGLTLSVTVGDLNQDGWPDLYVSNDFSTPDYFYINNKNGTFSEHVKDVFKQVAFYGMGADIADFNNDKLLDLVQLEMMAKDHRRAKANMASMNISLFWNTVNTGFHYQYMHNMLQMNNGVINDSLPDFSNVSKMAGMASTDWSWGALMADLDNDGWKDLYITNGTRREINNRDYFNKIGREYLTKDSMLSKSLAIPSEPIDNFAYRNKGDLTFEHANEKWGMVSKGFSNGFTYADLDNDGDLEVIINNIDEEVTVFKNNNTDNKYLALRFKGPEKNKFGIGVKVTLAKDTLTQFQELTLTRGFQSAVPPQMHFGVAKADKIDRVEVVWPNGAMQVLENVPTNQLLTLNFSEAKDVFKPAEKERSIFSSEKDERIAVKHKHSENVYNDFEKEILLPYRTSSLGPALAVGDLNKDGLDDFVVGGAAQYEAGVYFQTATGFQKQTITALQNDKQYEDVGCSIFDADGDGFNDMYMVSGGNEFNHDSKMLQDRLYRNLGNGKFERSDALPEMLSSGLRAVPFDYDKDGDMDLFVGGRLVPGNYPMPAKSYILENVSKKGAPKFRDVTGDVAPGLAELGMVSSAVWTDIDKDGAIDLIVVGEWLPISVFKNINGSFENVTKALSLENTTGWWSGMQQADFDQDGDMDYIVGNNGLNFKYKANEKETFDVYLNDFDKNSTNDIVFSYFNGGKKLPLRGRECSSQQMPAIATKFATYDAFSRASLEDVYTEQALESALHYQVKTFASIYLENKNGSFVVHKLPMLAQVSAINQILIEDFDGDGHLDAVVAGNLHWTEVETPRNDAGIGLFLKGNGKGSFEPVRGFKSGLYLPGDVKDLAKIKVGNSHYIVAARNDDYLKWVKVEKD